jgi:pimeloyl-ACP methyl ester carboxylesterase
MQAVFVPGWGAPASLYAPLLPRGWRTLAAPPFGTLDAHVLELLRELRERGRAALAGHSMGGAVAVLAAARAPQLVEGLTLVSPAGLPIVKPKRHSVADFGRQVARGAYPRTTAARGLATFMTRPRSALRLADEVRGLDLRMECERIRRHGLPVTVVGCATDTLIRAEHSRELASALGGEYVELNVPGGHMWMLGEPREFSALLRR